MNSKKTWQTFFDAHAPEYDKNSFTSNTLTEVDFVIEELGLKPGDAVLDVGCGTGRHSVELAKRGYKVVGIDISEEMLKIAQEKAKREGVTVVWMQGDAADFDFDGEFDAVVCLCEGAFGLLSQGENGTRQAIEILDNVSRALKPSGKTIFTMLNAFAMIRKYSDEDVAEGRFDPLTLTESSDYPPTEGAEPLPVRERAFVPTEVVMLFDAVDLNVLNIWGGTAGSWNRQQISLDEIEIMVVAEKD